MRILVAGLGSIGRRHLANLRSLIPRATIAVLRSGVSGFDSTVPTGADRVFYKVADALAFKPELAVIATPSTHHTELGRTLVAVGAHLFIEKPIAADPTGVAELLDEADRFGRIVLVGYNLVFTDAMRCLRAEVASGRIGRVLFARAEVGQYLPDWRPGTDYRRGASARADLGGGVLLELSHELHYLMRILGEVRSVKSCIRRTGTLEIDVEDLALLTLDFASGAVACVQLNFLQRTYSRSCTLVGTEGTLIWNAALGTVSFHKPGDNAGIELHSDRGIDRNAAYLRELAHLISCMAGDTNPIVSGREALKVLELVMAAKYSDRIGRDVTL